MQRWFANLLMTPLALRRAFPPATLAAINAAVAAAEAHTSAEIRVAVETALPLEDLFRNHTARDRALAVFSRLGVWDTAANNGVLLYVLLAERDIEIVADRGFAGRVGPEAWEGVCRDLEQALGAGRQRDGCLEAVAHIARLAAPHFPPGAREPNELPDAPVVL